MALRCSQQSSRSEGLQVAIGAAAEAATTTSSLGSECMQEISNRTTAAASCSGAALVVTAAAVTTGRLNGWPDVDDLPERNGHYFVCLCVSALVLRNSASLSQPNRGWNEPSQRSLVSLTASLCCWILVADADCVCMCV